MTALRSLQWQDIPVVAEMELRLFGADAWSESTWWQELAQRPRRWYVVATPDDSRDLAGYAGLDLGEVADVMTIAVVPEARGSGLGRWLLDTLVDAATASGAASVMLEVRADNSSARRLYERKGFSVLTTRPRYYQPGDVDALVMRLATALPNAPAAES